MLQVVILILGIIAVTGGTLGIITAIIKKNTENIYIRRRFRGATYSTFASKLIANRFMHLDKRSVIAKYEANKWAARFRDRG